MLRRHPVLSALGFFLLALAVGAAIFVATFDLNRYRTEIQNELSDLLHQPVHIGEAHLALLKGPSLDFKDLRIGAKGAEGNILRARNLYLQLEFTSLLHGRITFSSVTLGDPSLRVILLPPRKGKSAPSPPPAPPSKKGLLAGALVRTLTVEGGTIRLIDRRNPEGPITTTFENLQGRFSDLSLKNPLRLQLTGALEQKKGPGAFSLAGKIAPPANLADWRAVGLDLSLSLHNLAPEGLLQEYLGRAGAETAGQLSVSVKMKGSPAGGLKLDGQAAGKEFSLSLPSRYRHPFPIRKLRFSTTWTAGKNRQSLENLALEIDDLTVEGRLALSRKDRRVWLEGALSSPGISVGRLLEIIPDRRPASPAALLRKHLTAGTLSLEKARFDGPLSDFGRFDAGFPLKEAKISLQGGTIRIGPDAVLEKVGASATLANNRLTLKGGEARLGGSPLRFSGSVERLFQPDRRLRLDAKGALPVRKILALVSAKKPRQLSLGGTIPLKLAMTGPRNDLKAELSADLDALTLRFGKTVSKAAGQKGTLSLSAELTPASLFLKQGRLVLPFLTLEASGTLQRAKERAFKIALDVPRLEMAKARRQVPVLKKLDARGSLSLHYELSGSGGRIRNRRGNIRFHDFGIHVVRAIADINHTNGRIRLSGDRAELDNVALKMGSSALRVRGTVRGFPHPRFDLRVRGKAVHGEDLAFLSTDAVIRDVDAHLLIDRSHIAFEPVTVRLDGGTDATVRGTITDFRAPKVRLDITSRHADIDQVIRLWHKPRKKNRRPRRKTTVHITARVKEGTLGQLHFQNAEGVISTRQGVLTIHPLHFHAGKGYCTGQVVVDHSAGSPPLLKISGHLENFDAAAIYRELLKRRGLVTGTLKGDFYLEGRAGKSFLSTSLGGFNMEVENGVLHKFQFLSKVFSLLNVSQILTFRLPDMSLEGMPFNSMKGSFSLRRGVLKTQDLLVNSSAMNLSLVGDVDLNKQTLDLTLGIKPLRTVDKIVTNLPIVGWILTGKEKALITVYFRIRGKTGDPEVIPVPVTSVSKNILGIFRRVLQLPGKMITDMGKILGGEKSKKGAK